MEPLMGIALGPVPAELRERIREWVVADRWAAPGTGPDAVLIDGGPGYCILLTAEGEMYVWCPWDDSLTRIEDGPTKVREGRNRRQVPAGTPALATRTADDRDRVSRLPRSRVARVLGSDHR
jgi:hypothetical protein